MIFTDNYLRVLSPKTTNGVNVKVNGRGQVEYKETFLPLTAKKQLEKKNARLVAAGAPHLVAIIEQVGEEPQPVVRNPKPRK